MVPSSDCRKSKEPAADRVCKIVTFYEDFASAIRAQKTFGCLAKNFAGSLPVKATSWSFSMLRMPRFKPAVVRDAGSANVLVIAANGRRELPPHIAGWVERCIRRNPDDKPVVVALHEDGLEPKGEPGPLCASVNRIAGRRGATFMCSRDLEALMDHGLPVEPIHDAARSPIRVPTGTRCPISSTHRWWGINE